MAICSLFALIMRIRPLWCFSGSRWLDLAAVLTCPGNEEGSDGYGEENQQYELLFAQKAILRARIDCEADAGHSNCPKAPRPSENGVQGRILFHAASPPKALGRQRGGTLLVAQQMNVFAGQAQDYRYENEAAYCRVTTGSFDTCMTAPTRRRTARR